MKQFDIIKNPDAQSARRRPYLLILQSDFLHVVESVIAAPLAPENRTTIVPRLMPIIEVEGAPYALMTYEMSAISRSLLRRVVGNAVAKREDIIAAVDLVFLGF